MPITTCVAAPSTIRQKHSTSFNMGPYDEAFFNKHATYSSASADRVVPAIIQWCAPKSVVDVGCGIGTWLSVFEKHGVKDILGIDGDYVNRNQLLFNADHFLSHDLTQPLAVAQTRRFDLAVSLEVGEHLPPANAAQLIDTLVSFAPVVLFSAAIPHQGGTYHINEQWPNYWAKLFAQKGYVTVDILRPRIWSDKQVEYYYAQNSLFYVDKAHLDKFPDFEGYVVSADDEKLSAVHPTKWLQKNNPPPTPLKDLMRALPTSFVHSMTYYLNRILKKA